MTELTEERADRGTFHYLSTGTSRGKMRFKMDREMVQIHAPDF